MINQAARAVVIALTITIISAATTAMAGDIYIGGFRSVRPTVRVTYRSSLYPTVRRPIVYRSYTSRVRYRSVDVIPHDDHYHILPVSRGLYRGDLIDYHYGVYPY